MPGARHPSFRLGDRTELLVEFCLNTVAFTTRVPRQEDIGHDFFCVLSEIRDNLIWAGPSFTAQVKSDSAPLVFEKPHEVTWVKELENPFFLAVGDRDALCVDLYSTWGRLNGFLRKDARRIVLQPGPPVAGRNQVWMAPDGSQIIALGEPVIRATIKDFMDKARARVLSQVLKQWIELDRENIVNSRAGMHWVVGPETYKTNERFAAGTRLIAWIYWSAQNLERCQVNFGRAATALRLTIRNALGVDGERDNAFIAQVEALNAALLTYGQVLDRPSREALRRVGVIVNDECMGDMA